MGKQPSYEELKAKLEEIWAQNATQSSAVPDRDDSSKTPVPMDAISPDEECITRARMEFLLNSPPFRTCPVCGKQLIERERSALELWEALLSAGPAGEKDWDRRMLGRLLQLANYILVMAAVVVLLAIGWYVVSGELWLLMRTFLWWMPALVVLIALLLLQDWWKRTRANQRGR